MIRSTIMTTLLATSLSSVAFADTPDEKPAKNSIGFSAGWIVGNGLMYRRYFDDQFVQGTFAASYDKENDQNYFDFGLSYGRYLHKIDWRGNIPPVALKALGGLEVEHDSTTYDTYDYSASPGGTYVSRTDTRNETHFGAGVGIEAGNPGKQGLTASFDLLYVATFKGFQAFEFTRLELLPALSLFYNW